MRNLTVSTAFDYERIYSGKENNINLMITMTAPIFQIKEQERIPLEICAALDVSGSMGGKKLDMLKKSFSKFIDNLSSKDRISVLAFSTHVTEITPEPLCATAENKEFLKKQVDKLRTVSDTNISAALQKMFEILDKSKGKTRIIKRAILFTDGQATSGITNYEGLMDIVQKRDSEITISTFGYGSDHDGELLGSMARVGKGNPFYIQDINDCTEYFGLELGGLLLTYARDIKLNITPKNGVTVSKILNNFNVSIVKNGEEKEIQNIPEKIQVLLETPVEDSIIIKPDDLYSEESRKILIELKIPQGTSSDCIADILVDFENAESGQRETAACKAIVKLVAETDVQTKPNAEVEEQVLILNSAQAQHEARIVADRGDYQSAKQILSAFSVQLENANSFNESIALHQLRDGMVQFSTAINNYSDSVRNAMAYSATGITKGRTLSKGMATSNLYATKDSLTDYVSLNFLNKNEDANDTNT